MQINYLKLEKELENFIEFVQEKDNGRKFSSFDTSPYLQRNEGYKEVLWQDARTKLGSEDWSKNLVGSGEIIGSVIASIEIPTDGNYAGNNLVRWQSRYGDSQREHQLLYDSKENTNQLEEIEQTFFKLYNDIGDDADHFSVLSNHTGRYPFLAYIFFVKDKGRYLPIAPRNFDRTFQQLGIDFTTTRKASWENYTNYLKIIDAIREFVDERFNSEVTLLDTHSFLWVLYHQMEEEGSSDNDINIPIARKIELTPFDGGKSSTSNSSVTKEAKFDREQEKQLQEKRWRRGDKAESYVLMSEQKRLREKGMEGLAQNVEIVSDNTTLGYDIKSYNVDGTKRYIEVKTDSGGHFFLSRNQKNKAGSKENYYIYLVNFSEDTPDIKYFHGRELQNGDNVELKPEKYRVYFKEA